MKEIWKDIKGYEGYYQISNLGRVKSVDRIIYCHGTGYVKKGNIRKISSSSKGYYQLHLNKNGTRQTKLIHRLIAEAFINNPQNKKCVNHKDFNITNNSVDNLEWCTQKENIRYSFAHGRFDCCIENLKKRIITKSNYKKNKYLEQIIKEYVENKKTIHEISTFIPIHETIISKILRENHIKIKGGKNI